MSAIDLDELMERVFDGRVPELLSRADIIKFLNAYARECRRQPDHNDAACIDQLYRALPGVEDIPAPQRTATMIALCDAFGYDVQIFKDGSYRLIRQRPA